MHRKFTYVNCVDPEVANQRQQEAHHAGEPRNQELVERIQRGVTSESLADVRAGILRLSARGVRTADGRGTLCIHDPASKYVCGDNARLRQYGIAIRARLQAIAKERLLDGELEALPGLSCLMDRETRRVILDHTDGRKKGPFVWVTINFDPSAKDWFEATQQWTGRNEYVRDHWALYCFEQRSDDPTRPSGYHVHALFCRHDTRPARVKEQLRKSFKKVADVYNPSILYMKFLTQEVAKEKATYIFGRKKESKQVRVAADRKWRELNEMKDFYTHGQLPPYLVELAPQALEEKKDLVGVRAADTDAPEVTDTDSDEEEDSHPIDNASSDVEQSTDDEDDLLAETFREMADAPWAAKLHKMVKLADPNGEDF